MASSRNGLEVRVGQVDWISRLPDEVLCHILSLLPTKYGIRMSVLSKRWENLWILVPKIDFTFDLDEYEGSTDSFTRSIENLLFLRDNLCIESFRLSHKLQNLNIDCLHLSSWLYAVLTCNIRVLDLEMGSNNLGELPWMLFTCKTLVSLKIRGAFIINVPYYVFLPNLTTFVLDGVIFVGDVSIPKFLSGCPALEDLQLLRDSSGCDPTTMCDVSHSTLKRLTLQLDDVDHEQADKFPCEIKVDVPNLEFIELSGHWLSDLGVNYFPSIIKADVYACQAYRWEEITEHENKVLAFLRSIANVECLFLTLENSKNCFHSVGLDLPKFCNLVQLKIYVPVVNFSKLLMYFLESSPKLEVLSLPCGVESEEMDSDDDDDMYNNLDLGWHDPQHVPECLTHSLKRVHLGAFRGEKESLQTVKYLLEKALILENMTICCVYSPSSIEFVELRRELLKHPWGSTNCQLDFLEFT